MFSPIVGLLHFNLTAAVLHNHCKNCPICVLLRMSNIDLYIGLLCTVHLQVSVSSDNSVTHSHVEFNTINAIIIWNATTLHIVHVSLLQGWARTAHALCMHSCSVASYEAVRAQPTPVYKCILFLCCLSAFVCYIFTYVVHFVLVDCFWLALSCLLLLHLLRCEVWAGLIPSVVGVVSANEAWSDLSRVMWLKWWGSMHVCDRSNWMTKQHL